MLSYQDFFALAHLPTPNSPELIVERLCEHKLATRVNGGSRYDITNLGAILFARQLSSFGARLGRKTVRVVVYKGSDRTATDQEYEGHQGYASGFQGLVEVLLRILPRSEEIQKALRISVPKYPELALRELAANTLVHQDFDIGGAGPIVEVFSDRVEFTNPGAPLVDVQRFLDLPARSRNESLAHMMRLLGICEERGSGIDKVVTAAEIHQLPPPDFLVVGDNTKAVLFAPRPFEEMSRGERIRACYQHAGLEVLAHRLMNNESLRKRFGLADAEIAKATRVITESRRHAKYLPWWAASLAPHV